MSALEGLMCTWDTGILFIDMRGLFVSLRGHFVDLKYPRARLRGHSYSLTRGHTEPGGTLNQEGLKYVRRPLRTDVKW